MDRLKTETSTSGSIIPTTEKRALNEVLHSAKRTGGNYGSLAKSQLQPTFYIYHKLETDDTLQRLALKYSINMQEIKRVNKLWSDSKLGLLEHVYIPVNSTQLSTLQIIYPTLHVVQSLSSSINSTQKSSTNDEKTSSSIQSSDSSISIPAIASSYQDYLSKIDQQIQSSKQSLQSLDVQEQSPKSRSTAYISNHDDESDKRNTSSNNRRHKGAHYLSDNSTYVNITTQNSRDKHISAALERIQREKDNFDEL